MAVERLAVLELDELCDAGSSASACCKAGEREAGRTHHGLGLRGVQQCQRKLRARKVSSSTLAKIAERERVCSPLLCDCAAAQAVNGVRSSSTHLEGDEQKDGRSEGADEPDHAAHALDVRVADSRLSRRRGTGLGRAATRASPTSTQLRNARARELTASAALMRAGHTQDEGTDRCAGSVQGHARHREADHQQGGRPCAVQRCAKLAACARPPSLTYELVLVLTGMTSPLLGIAGVNSLLFASNAFARKLVNPYGPKALTLSDVMVAGGIAGAAQAILASPVEMFKIRMQGQYGRGGKRLRDVVGGMYREYGWRQGIMRGYWVRRLLPSRMLRTALTRANPLTRSRSSATSSPTPVRCHSFPHLPHSVC